VSGPGGLPAVLADALAALAGWIDDQLAGGAPPKHVAQVAADALRWIAAELTRGET
jgi:hypothetical protein